MDIGKTHLLIGIKTTAYFTGAKIKLWGGDGVLRMTGRLQSGEGSTGEV